MLMFSDRSALLICATLLVASAVFFSFGCAEDADLGLTQAALTTDDQRTCFEDCMAAGGEERDCLEACIDWDSVGTRAGEECYDGCLEMGGSVEDCRERCADGADRPEESAESACYDACMSEGGEAEACREACTDDAPVEMSAEDCYAQCEAAGGTDADCDERCGDGAL
jgi:hypothetical protein